eukprot:GGOE01038872.1.p2 GENE.GGOE01038872.1~~GGOE01038872.1.p2  ORF type:complete len:483 (+),score=98.54 GGOE01038872.1:353-1801(+)
MVVDRSSVDAPTVDAPAGRRSSAGAVRSEAEAEVEELRRRNAELLELLEAQRQELDRFHQMKEAMPRCSTSGGPKPRHRGAGPGPSEAGPTPHRPSPPPAVEVGTSCHIVQTLAAHDAATSCRLPAPLCDAATSCQWAPPATLDVSTSCIAAPMLLVDACQKVNGTVTKDVAADGATATNILQTCLVAAKGKGAAVLVAAEQFSPPSSPECLSPADGGGRSPDDIAFTGLLPAAGEAGGRRQEVLIMTAGNGPGHRTNERKAKVLQRLMERAQLRKEKPQAPLRGNPGGAAPADPLPSSPQIVDLEICSTDSNPDSRLSSGAPSPSPPVDAGRSSPPNPPRQARAPSLPRSPPELPAAPAVPVRGNLQVIRNALKHVCLAGRVNEKALLEVLHAIKGLPAAETAKFVIVLRDVNQPTYRAMYVWQSPQELLRICGTGPKVLDPVGVQTFLKYDCGGKRFTPVSARLFDVLVDAVVRIRSPAP